MNQSKNPIAAYKALKASGLDAKKACYAIMESCGLDSSRASDICWAVETDAPAPKWLHDDGQQTQASVGFYAGLERQMDGE